MASSIAFAVLCAVLAQLGRVPPVETGWAAAAVVLVLVPTAWWAPVGWRRRVAEMTLALPAWALVMLANPVQRRMVLPPLLLVVGVAAVVAAWPRIPVRDRSTALIFVALSARASVGMGLVGHGPWRVALAFATGLALAWCVGRLAGRDAAIGAALLAAVFPFQTQPVAAGVVVVVALAAGAFGDPSTRRTVGAGSIPGLLAVVLVGAALAAWGSLGPSRAFPETTTWVLALLILAPALFRVPAMPAGVVWVGVVLALGAAITPTPDRRGFELGGELASVDLPTGNGAPYVLDIRLDGDHPPEPGTAVAWFRVGDRTHRLLYPDHAAPRSGGGVASPNLVWRPEAVGAGARWRCGVRSRFEVPGGVVPRLIRHPDLDPRVRVLLETEGPARPTPPRTGALAWWIGATAIVVSTLQLLSGAWRTSAAVVPWTILATGALVARTWVEPLRLLGERHAVDLALAALLAAWLPVATGWLRSRRVALAVAALLVPLAVATPHLTPPLHGDEPFHLAVMDSILGEHDLDLDDNIDLDRHPQEASFQQDGDLLHSPLLGVLLLPGFAVAGRVGALVLLAVAASLAAALVVRRARRLGVPETRLRIMTILLACTYPLATFATQIWVEVVGILSVSAILVAVSGGRGGRWAAVGWAVLATAVKTRLGLLVFPSMLAGWWGRRRGRWVGILVLAGAAVVAGGVGWLTMGHPFGIYRRFHHLLPSDPGQSLRVIGGLAVDPTGGLLFSAPLWLVALAGTVALWRRGGPGERLLLVGCGATVAALLHSLEWYGGGSPPARYLVPMLPAVALAGGFVLREPRRWRSLTELLLLPSSAVWWVLVTRPHHSVNPGDGGWWAADALARSYLVDTAWLVPSFLVPRSATWVVPAVAAGLALTAWAATRLKPAIARRLSAGGAAIWLLAAAGLVVAIEHREDRVVELEAPQVRRHGGSPHPAEGIHSRFTHRRGWKLADGESVTVPLNLGAGSTIILEGWLLGTARQGAAVELVWDEEDPIVVRVRGDSPVGRLEVPAPPGKRKAFLSITLRARPHGALVLDRVVVERKR
jgi:hypothetical protein